MGTSSSKRFSTALSASLLFCLSATSAVAEPAEDASKEKKISILKRITVVGEEENIDKVPGSVHFVNKEEIEKQGGADDIHRVLRKVPGVNVQEEEGYGLRPNIGFRGVPNERSGKITLMEDGVLTAPATYSAPAAYYFPPVGRMEGVEVIKGAGQVKYGPYTTGGSLNLLSTAIPEKEVDAKIKYSLGNDNLRKTHAYVGGSTEYVGGLLETYQLETDGFKDLDGGGNTGVDLEDYLGKFRVNTDKDAEVYNELEFKVGSYNQFDNETYMGLTEEDFDSDPFRRYAGSQLDTIDVDHRQYSVRHFAEFSEALDLTTTAYYHETQRNWRKIESVGGSSLSNILGSPEEFAEQLAWIKGETSAEDAFSLRNNQRAYEAKGIQTVLGYDFETGDVKHELEFGIRYHEDEEDRFQADEKYGMQNGRLVFASIGAPGSQTNRIGSAEAWAFFVQDKITIEKLTLVPGVRYENVDYTNEDFGKTDPERAGTELKSTSYTADEVIPGLGAQYQFTDEFGSFAGVHKGFSPPGPRGDTGADSEESIAYELGSNYNVDSFKSEVVLFYSDYDNLLGADTLSAGGEGTGDLFNAGKVDVYGVELGLGYDVVEPMKVGFKVPVYGTYTYTNAEFRETFDSEFFGEVEKGDNLTYVPEHQFALGVGLEIDRYAFYVDGHYVDEMNTVPGESGSPSDAKTDSHFTVDILTKASLTENCILFASVQNLLDEEYVVARRPAGARPGLPLTGLVGIEFKL